MKRPFDRILKDARQQIDDDFTVEDAYWLIEDTFHLERYQIFLLREEIFDDTLFMERLKRARSVPVAYILGYREFFSRRFVVNPDVLIPRNETEELVEKAIAYIATLEDEVTVLDVGTGSGCIAVTLKAELKKLGRNDRIIASDISEKALNIAKKNAEILNEKISFIKSDCLEKIDEDIDVIVSNPPYISKDGFISERVKNNEPHLALFAEEKGTEIYHRILEQGQGKRVRAYFFEISPEQEEILETYRKRYLPDFGSSYEKDMNGLIRFAIFKKPE